MLSWNMEINLIEYLEHCQGQILFGTNSNEICANFVLYEVEMVETVQQTVLLAIFCYNRYGNTIFEQFSKNSLRIWFKFFVCMETYLNNPEILTLFPKKM